MEKLAKETEFAAGYVRVKTPHLAREKMYKTSGHLPYYAESMFPPMEMPLEEDAKHKKEALEIKQRTLTTKLQMAQNDPGASQPRVSISRNAGRGG